MAKVVAKVYGTALFDLAKDRNELDLVEKEAKTIQEILQSNVDLEQLLNHPRISKTEKIETVQAIFSRKYSDTIVGLLVIVIEKSRFDEIHSILEHYHMLYREYYRIGIAHVISAIELSYVQKQKVKEKLLETTSYKTVEIEYRIDPSIIGGLIIRLGDRVVDSSIKSQIESMKKDLMRLQLAN